MGRCITLCAPDVWCPIEKFWYVVGQIVIRESGSRQSYSGNRNYFGRLAGAGNSSDYGRPIDNLCSLITSHADRQERANLCATLCSFQTFAARPSG